jgi:hypothetical protein
MSKHEARLKKQYSATLKEARNLIDTRLARQEVDMKQAMRVRRADAIDGGTTNLHELGFVFSPEEVDAAIRKEDALALVHQVLVQDRMNKRSGAGYATDSDSK